MTTRRPLQSLHLRLHRGARARHRQHLRRPQLPLRPSLRPLLRLRLRLLPRRAVGALLALPPLHLPPLLLPPSRRHRPRRLQPPSPWPPSPWWPRLLLLALLQSQQLARLRPHWQPGSLLRLLLHLLHRLGAHRVAPALHQHLL